MLGNFKSLLSSAEFSFEIIIFKNISLGMREECITIWIQIIKNILSLIGFRLLTKFISERALAGMYLM